MKLRSVFLFCFEFTSYFSELQLQAIFSDETAVEQAKKQGAFRANLSKKALLAEVFGRGIFVILNRNLFIYFLCFFCVLATATRSRQMYQFCPLKRKHL